MVGQFHALDSMLGAVRAGLGVNLSADSIQSLLGPDSGLVYRHVDGLQPLEHFLVRRAGDRRQIVEEFATAARDSTRQVTGAR